MQHALPRSVLPSVCISVSTQCSTHHLNQYYPLCVYPYEHSAARITQISTTDCVYISPYEHSTHYPSQYYRLCLYLYQYDKARITQVSITHCISLSTQCSTHYPGQYYPLCVFPCQHNAARITQVSITHCVSFLVNTMQHALPRSVLPIVCVSLSSQSCSTPYPNQCYRLCVHPYGHSAARITQVSTTDCLYFLYRQGAARITEVLLSACSSLLSLCCTHYRSQYYRLCAFPLRHSADHND